LYSAQNDENSQSNTTAQGISDADPDPLARSADLDHAPDPGPDPDPDPSVIKQNDKKNLESYCFVISL
jgi:hypothetical protein